MGTIREAFASALLLILHPSPELVEIVMRTLQVSGAALALASALGVPTGAAIALNRFPLKGALLSVLNAFMGLPPVVVGLLVYLILSRSGPLGFMSLLYSPAAI